MKEIFKYLALLKILLIFSAVNLFSENIKIDLDHSYFFEEDSSLFRWELYYSFDE